MRLAVTENKKEAAAFKQNEERKARKRAYYRKKHSKKSGENRGRKRIKKQKYKAEELSNGDTKVELLTRSRNQLAQPGEKWGEHKKERARLLFDLYPQMKEAYSLICKVRDIFKRKHTVDEAEAKLHNWYKEVNNCTFREIKSARDCIKSREEEVLNYFLKRSTNASAESLNSKMKGGRGTITWYCRHTILSVSCLRHLRLGCLPFATELFTCAKKRSIGSETHLIALI